ncbi:TolC family protein [Persephonella sp.]
MHIFLLIILVFCIPYAGAREITLGSLEEKALKNNYLIKEKESEIKILKASREAIRLTRVGDIAFSFLLFPSQNYAEKITGYQYGVTGKVRYPLWGEMKDIKYTGKNLQSVIYEKEAELFRIKQDVLYRLRSAYLDYYINYNLINQLENLQYSLKKLKNKIMERYNRGYLIWSDILDVENSLSRVNTLLVDAYENKYRALAEIRTIISQPHLEEFTPVKLREDIKNLAIPSVEELYRFALENRKDIKLMEKAYSLLKHAYTEDGKPFPRMWITAFGGIVNDATADSTKFIPGFGLSLDISSPVRLTKANDYMVIERKNRAVRKLFRLKMLENSIITDIQTGVSNFEVYREKYIHFKKQAAGIKEKTELLKERSKLGLKGADEYLKKKLTFLSGYAYAYSLMMMNYRGMVKSYFKLLSSLGVAEIPWVLSSRTPDIYTLSPSERQFQIDRLKGIEFEAYVWKTENILKDRRNIKFFIADLSSAGLKGVYFSLNGKQIASYLTSSDNNLSVLLEEAHLRDINVELLLGENTWIYPENREKLIRIVKLADDFNAKHTYGFSAIHLDIEPHSLPDFQLDTEGIIQLYLKTLYQVRKNSKMKVCVDISYRYADIKAGKKTLAEKVLETVDCVNVMLYTTDIDRIEKYAKIYRKLKKTYKKDIRISLSVEKDQPPYISLFKHDVDRLLKILDVLKKYGFKTVAFQNYSDFTAYMKINSLYVPSDNPALRKKSKLEIIKTEEANPQSIGVQ